MIKEIYSVDLHNALNKGAISEEDKRDGVYLVMFRVLKKGSNILIYNNVYYPNMFVRSLIEYLVTKKNFKHSFLFKEWGDYFTFISDEFSIDSFIKGFLENYLRKNEHFQDYLNTGQLSTIDNYTTLFDIVKKTVHVNKSSVMTDFISLCANKQYKEIIELIGVHELCVGELNSDIYLLKDCLFIVKDIDSLLNELKEKGFVVNKGTKGKREQLNSLSSFLGCLDGDYRQNLYNLQSQGVQSGYIPHGLQLARSKYSFKNVHMNMGNVKWYSSLNKPKTTRQDLFQENYRLVGDILEKNSYVGSKDIQLEIEKVLRNQENEFSNMNVIKSRLMFSDKAFDILSQKKEELKKLLDFPDDFNVNVRFHSTKYIPLVRTITAELGTENIANLLLAYFMKVLTKETVTLEDVETPGISTIKSFDDFGKTIFTKFIYSMYIKSEFGNNTLSVYENSIKGDYELVYNEEGSYAMLGGYFIWNLVSVRLLTEVLDKHPEDPKETVHYLRIVQSIREVLIQSNVKTYHLPQKLPMVCEPKKYEYSSKGLTLGGYLLNDVYYTESLIKERIGLGKQTTLKDPNIIIDMVNGMSKTPFKVNTNVLEYIYKYGVEKKILTDDSSAELKLFLANPYKGFSKKSSKHYRSLISKILMERNVLSIAEVFSRLEKIYFPVRLDFRTRIYCKTDYFDYQQSDLAKGLILFANPGLISRHDLEVIKYFKAYGANMYGHGLDKKSLNQRVKWIDDNSTKILNFEFNDIVDTAENKVCFIAFCYEYTSFINFLESKEKIIFKTYLPIQLDATCNGYQHLVLLTKETKLMNKLNLDMSTHDDDPNDFYSYVVSQAKSFIESEIIKLKGIKAKSEKENTYYESLLKLDKINLGRSVIKKIIMRESYSAGIPRLVSNVLTDENMTEHEKGKNTYYTYLGSDIKLKKYDIVIFVKILKDVTARIAPKIKELSKYLDAIVTICTRLDIPIPWTLPSGADIPQSYLVEKERKIAAFSFTKSKYTFKKYLDGQFDLRKQKRAIRPNLIHSLDGTTIAMLYNTLGNMSLYTVHDCFAVTANNVPTLIQKLQMVYIKLYSSNTYLLYFDKMVRLTINQTLGDDIMQVNGKYVNIPYKKKLKRELFPDINKIITIDNNSNIENLVKSSYIII